MIVVDCAVASSNASVRALFQTLFQALVQTLVKAFGVTEAKDGGIDSLVRDILTAWFGMDEIRIDQNQGLIDEHRGVGTESLAKDIKRKRVCVVLADAAHLGMLVKEFFEPVFVFNEL